MQRSPVIRGPTAAIAVPGGRSLTSLDLLLCMLPICLFLSIVSFV